MFSKLSIINDLFICFKLPVIIFDKKLSVLIKYNYNDNLMNTMSKLPLISDLKNIEFKPEILKFEYNALNFTCICFFNEQHEPSYLSIGPYILTYNNAKTSNNILEITNESLLHMQKLCAHILGINNATALEKLNTFSPLVKGAIEYIHNHYKDPITINTISCLFNVNKCYFCNLFKKETGNTFTNYLNLYRTEKSKELLKNSSFSLLDISLSVGFNNQSYYSTIFKKYNNMTPLEYRLSSSI